jgi:Na+-driven multidrug efflux pump
MLPSVLISGFTSDKAIIEIGEKIARMMFISLPLAGISSMVIAHLQGTCKAKQALLFSLIKVYILVLPLLFIIQYFWGFEKLWYAFPVADLVATILFSSYLVSIFKKQQMRLAKVLS